MLTAWKPGTLWKRFVRWRVFHRRYMLVAAGVYTSIGPFATSFSWQNGSYMRGLLNERRIATDWKLTRRARVMVPRYYALREPTTGRPDAPSSAALPSNTTKSSNSST